MSVLNKISKSRVSSVLNKDSKQFGKLHLFDGDDETCWNSDQGSPQWILLEFDEEVGVNALHIQFQGGFAGKDCWIEAPSTEGDLQNVDSFYPENQNQTQVFKLTKRLMLKKLKIVFNSSSDFFGRITIYKLDLIDES